MATATVTRTKRRDMECPICHEQFKQPKILPCGHLLCRDCLVTRLQSHLSSCPLCRGTITQHGTYFGITRSSEVIADGFPSDVTMAALVEADRVLSRQHQCCVCGEAAVDLCIDCSDMFCTFCSQVHTKQSVTKLHTMESLSLTTAETLAASRPAACDVHSDQVSKLYCPTHDAYICFLCLTAHHRQCLDVTKLEGKMAEVHVQLTELCDTLEAGEAALDQAIAKVNGELSHLDSQRHAALAQIDATFDSLEAALKAQKNFFRRKAQRKVREAKSKVVERRTRLQARKEMTTPYSLIVRRATGFQALGAVRQLTTVMQDRVRRLDFTTTLPIPVDAAPNLTFALDPEAVERVKQHLAALDKSTKRPAALTDEEWIPPPCKQIKLSKTPKTTERTSRSSGDAIVLPRDEWAPDMGLDQELPALLFHENHGKHIKLSKNFTVAERTSRIRGDAIVMSRDEMVPDMLYQVQIKINNHFKSTVLGVVIKRPDTITLKSTYYCRYEKLPPEVLVVAYDWIGVFGTSRRESRPVLEGLAVGSKVGLALHSDRNLHLYVDGQHQGLMAQGLPSPCYFMFDLFSRCTKVTALPVTPLRSMI